MQSKIAGKGYIDRQSQGRGGRFRRWFLLTADFHAAARGVLATGINYSVAPGLLARHRAYRHQAGGEIAPYWEII